MNGAPTPIEASDAGRLVKNPRVSVVMTTYNHAEFLAEAIEGVLAQVCGFEFELIIGEDASTDGTLDVALGYQKSNPEVIRVVYASANVGPIANFKRALARCRGEFVAFCEGDDYWCSPRKLARQVESMGDPAIGIVHADWFRIRRNRGRWTGDPAHSVHRRVAPELLQGDLFRTWHFPKILRTCTILLRRRMLEEWLASDLWKKEYRFGDSVLSAYVVSRARVAYVPEVVAAYRHSANSALRSGMAARIRLYKSCLEFDTDARAFFAGRADYGDGYRWDNDVALLLWSLRAGDFRSMIFACRDIAAHFSAWHFVVTGWRTIRMRLPTWRRQPRDVPEWPSTKRR